MRLDITRNDLINKFMGMTTEELVDWLVDSGLELTSPKATRGIYRRELGTDLVRADGFGGWNHVNQHGNDDPTREITWACFDSSDWWVMVLDSENNPMTAGPRILMDAYGYQID